MRHREPAICLRTIDYSETSQVLHFLTRGAGTVRVLGKGTKRPKSKSGGAIDLLQEGQLVFSTGRGQGLATLIEFTETVSHSALRKEAGRLNTSVYMLELAAAMLGEGDPHAEVFDLLHNALARLGHTDAPVQAVLAYFQWRLLRHVGLLGQLSTCVCCSRAIAPAHPDQALRQTSAFAEATADFAGQAEGPVGAQGPVGTQVSFSSTQGGLICAACRHTAQEKLPLEPQTLEGLATLAAAETGKKVLLAEPCARAVNRMLAYHAAQQMGRWPRMARYAIGTEASGGVT